ncbi:MAG: Slp family lipoprotein [Gammaproteobacteria bacterium]|nr:Slp family lipoprotein [Gammaproteobacteria bacterium]
MHQKFLLLAPVALLITLLAGCATSPDFDTTGVDRSLTPRSVVAEPEISRGKTVLWGGTILNTSNLENMTQIEVLAYPLDSSQRPLLEDKPLGRFMVEHEGYLETATFAQGRLISVLGNIGDTQSGKVGKSPYTYPVVIAQQLHLWSLHDPRSRTSFHLGIGVRL